jgi:ribose 5-phosphate isomerase A
MDTMNQETLKQEAAVFALSYLDNVSVLGVGTGSTVNYFIDALAAKKHLIEAAVASSKATEQLLIKHGIPVVDLNSVGHVDLYIDGADEANHFLQLIKGGGGALTREKIVASAAKKFVCIIDESKFVDVLGENFPLPIEVIPLARSTVAHELIKMGGRPEWRENFVTDNGNYILDVYQFPVMEPLKIEQQLNQIPGVVSNGLFALRPADELVVASKTGVRVVRSR